ncbi:uncharacterized protein HMPREF1541_10748 [Cyphellophora europaea CBS 101466]|uniref:Uncharacterized protein n=1 Tax=Cyphellophora europaea (strain CBS 101466) TaxID=1220924 RepID=W2S668_CYPE1|nr:uncharacterized protein HMPREF1541_10748 [Cyphellophora europaea CBS 101466]ETN44197.1 hypothetical protein HMPREF1541_10748 [Cyphellophora europaea CBS 101466]
MSPTDTPWDGKFSCSRSDPYGPLKMDPNGLADLSFDPSIRAQDHVLQNPSLFPSVRPSFQDLHDMIGIPAFAKYRDAIDKQYEFLDASRLTIIAQLTADAYTKTGLRPTETQIKKSVEVLDRYLPIGLCSSAHIDPNRLRYSIKHGQRAVAFFVLKGLQACLAEVEVRNNLNMVQLKHIVIEAVEALQEKLVQVSMYQHGGKEAFKLALAANDHDVILYDTSALRTLLDEAQQELCDTVEDHASRMVAVTMQPADFRIWNAVGACKLLLRRIVDIDDDDIEDEVLW